MENNIRYFTLGFLTNACLWRLEQGDLDDIVFPASLAVLCVIGILFATKRLEV